MSFEAFRQELKKNSRPGACWRRADFHVHAPSSSDYEYQGEDAVELLGQEIRRAGYAFAVILQHEEFPSRELLAALQKHCPITTLIPGAEINVIVDALFKKVGKDYFAHCIVAVDPQGEGDYGYVLRKAREEFTYRPGDYPAGFKSSILDLAKFFRKSGALFIPAHLHQAKSPEQSRSLDDLYDDDAFLGFVRDDAFTALEVRQLSTASFFDGATKTKDGVLVPRAVCVASSDAHHHEHIAQRDRSTWVRVEERTFQELAAALSFPHRVALTPPVDHHSRVVGLHIVGSFIPQCWITFNEGLTALIGGKGSGKTAILECLRFVFNTLVPKERTDDVKRHIAHVLGASGFVECLIRKPDGSESLFARRADSPDRVTITEADGQTRTISSIENIGFPVSILGWHEIEAVADKPEARIALLDRIGDDRKVRDLYTSIRERVEHARDQMPVLQRQVKRLDSVLREFWDLQRKRSTLARLEQDDLVEMQNQYEWYLLTEQRLENLKSALAKRHDQLPEVVPSNMTAAFDKPLQGGPTGETKDVLSSLEESLRAIGTTEHTATATLQGAFSTAATAVDKASQALGNSFGAFRDTVYGPKVNALPPEDREVLGRQIQVLEETKRLPLVEQQCADLLREVRALAGELHSLCSSICEIRDQIVGMRTNLVSQLNEELSSVELTFQRSVNHQARDRFQSTYGQEGVDLVGYVRGFGKAESYENLKELFARLQELELTQDKWDVNRVLWDVKFVDLLDVLDEDDVAISLAVGKAGFVPIQNLSAGQRCVAVFPLLLRNTRGPLVIDQPEDNLDNRYIADTIAPDLLNRKQVQQFVVTSHNANLVVLTDADLIIHMDSDGAKCELASTGFLSCAFSAVRRSVVDVLDGGEGALAARQRKYGLGGSDL